MYVTRIPDNGILSVQDSTQLTLIEKKISSIRTFSDRDYYLQSIRNIIIKKLELTSPFWKNLKKSIFANIRKNGFVIVKGMPLDENDRLLIGFCSILGTPTEPYKRPDTHMVMRLCPGMVKDSIDERPHTDGAHWPRPNDLSVLQCINPDKPGKGISKIVHVNTILEQLEQKEMSEIIKQYSKIRYPFTLHPDFGSKGIQMKYILTKTKSKTDGPHIRFSVKFIQNCIEKFDLKIDSELIKSIVETEKIISKLGSKTQFSLKRGDWLIIDNKKTVHNRTAVSKDSKRLLKKIKLNIVRNELFN